MRLVVGTSAQPLPTGGRGRPVIQNLGPGALFVDTSEDVTPDSGLRLEVGDVYEFPTPGGYTAGLFLVADLADTDVRLLRVGG